MAKVYYDKDADLKTLKNKTVAVIGYGTQGRAQAQNLSDSGVNVIIGQRKGRSFNQARSDGFEPMPVEDAAKKGDFVQVLLPDELMPDIYYESVAPHIKKGNRGIGFIFISK